MEQWERFVHWYDLDQGDFQEDIPFYLALAQRTGSPILELGCGTGRLLLALAEAGYRVVGIDNLPAMLRRAEEKVAAAGGEAAGRVRLLLADFAQAELPERFQLVICAVNTLMHLADPLAQAHALRLAFQHLAPGGILALDLFHPHPEALTPGDGQVILEKLLTDPETGRQACKFVARQADYAQQIITTFFLYDEMDALGLVTRTAASFPMRYLYRPEVEQMLHTAGFVIEGVYGSYELDPYEDAAERMVFLARRPE